MSKFNILKLVVLGLSVFFLVVFVPMQTFGYKELSSPECRVQRWELPLSLQLEFNNLLTQQKPLPPLVPIKQSPFPCCSSDRSCLDQRIWGENGQPPDKKALLAAVDHSLDYLLHNSDAAYQNYQVVGMTPDGTFGGLAFRDRVTKSLQRFRELLLKSRSAVELNASVAREFVFYQSVGSDAKGSVLFTAYYEPVYAASRVPTPEYRYPIYRLPPDLDSWEEPYPTRVELEGTDGLQGANSRLHGLELFWLRDRLEAYVAQIEGSARLQFPDGTQTTIGYAGSTPYHYNSIGKELAKDGKLPLEGMTMPMILDYFQKHPKDLEIYIPRDPSFVFFQENHGAPAQGSIQQPLTAERSIATDKSLMPPGALALLHTSIPFVNANGKMEHRNVSRYVLDQDTGGAIKGAGRVDYFLGTGKVAGERAGVTVSNGNLYYLLVNSQK